MHESQAVALGRHGMPVRLWRSRELVFTLVKRDLKVRYKSSSLGFLWSLGKPFFLMLVITAVFGVIVRVPSSHPLLPYSLHLLTALLPWLFFSGVLGDSLHSILGNGNVIKKVWLPTEVFPASVVIGQLIHFVLAWLMLVPFVLAFMFFGSVPEGHDNAGAALGMALMPGWEIVFLPVLIAMTALLAFGFALILSSLNVFYRDVSSITEIALTAWLYMTPIIYPANFARDALQARGAEVLYWLWLCNPMTPITLAFRRITYGRSFSGAPEVADATLLKGLGISAVTTIVVLWFGMWLFERSSKRFADEI